MNTQDREASGVKVGYRERNLEPTADPRKMVSAVVHTVLGRGFNEQANIELRDYFRRCLRVARQMGRKEMMGRK